MRACLILLVAVAAAALVWPGPVLLGPRIEPFVLGLPFMLAWNIGWLLVVFAGLLVYHLAAGGEQD